MNKKIRNKPENMLVSSLISKNIDDINVFLMFIYEEIEIYNSNNPNNPLFVFSYVCDEPALKKVLKIKGHNGYSPCHICHMNGTLLSGSSQYYYPNSTIYENIDLLGYERLRNYETHKSLVEICLKNTDNSFKFGITDISALNLYNNNAIIDTSPYEWLHSFSLNLVSKFIERIIRYLSFI